MKENQNKAKAEVADQVSDINKSLLYMKKNPIKSPTCTHTESADTICCDCEPMEGVSSQDFTDKCKEMLKMIELLEEQSCEIERNLKKEVSLNEMSRTNYALSIKLNKERFNEIENVRLVKMEEQI